jgi:2,2-dialkylglycine decarboxylase (pyruvate)
VLDVLEEGGVGAAVAGKGELLAAGLRDLQAKHAVVGDVRGRGLMQGVEIVLDRATKESSPALGTAIMDRCLELGLHLNIVNLPELSGTFRIAPALTTTDDELRRGLDIMDQAIGDVAPEFVG